MEKSIISKILKVCGIIVLLSLISSPLAEAIPSKTPHTNTDKTIEFEEDGTEDGSSSHNHRSARSFNGFTSTAEPYSAFGVWDDRDLRVDSADAIFSSGHGFIEETATNATADRIPRYFFSNTKDVWPDDAKKRVRDAFNTWGAVISDDPTKLRTEIAFLETSTSANAEVTLFWEDLVDADFCGGAFNFVAKTQSFDSSLNWNFSVDPTGIAANEWHFYSIALHEIGHVVGLAHQIDAGDLLFPSVGSPTGGAGAGVPATCLGGAPAGTFFMGLDADSIEAVRDLYSIPVSLDLVFCIDTTGSMFDDIDAVKASATEIVNAIASKVTDFRIAVVDYRDQPTSPCGGAGDYCYNVDSGWSDDPATTIAAINSLSLGFGADFPEAVFTALLRTINTEGLGSGWRDGVNKIIILMGDAPPQDPDCCDGTVLADVVAASEAVDPVAVYPILIGGDPSASAAFSTIAEDTGGEVFNAATADDVVGAILTALGDILSSPPIAEAGGPYAGIAGSPITFDASGSSDPDGTIASFEWDWDSDGTFDDTTASPTILHTFSVEFSGTVVLRVTDDSGQTGIDTASVEACASSVYAKGNSFVKFSKKTSKDRALIRVCVPQALCDAIEADPAAVEMVITLDDDCPPITISGLKPNKSGTKFRASSKSPKFTLEVNCKKLKLKLDLKKADLSDCVSNPVKICVSMAGVPCFCAEEEFKEKTSKKGRLQKLSFKGTVACSP